MDYGESVGLSSIITILLRFELEKGMRSRLVEHLRLCPHEEHAVLRLGARFAADGLHCGPTAALVGGFGMVFEDVLIFGRIPRKPGARAKEMSHFDEDSDEQSE